MFKDKLENAWRKQNSLLCVGLDPDIAKIPKFLLTSPRPYFDFLRAIVDATQAHCAAFKPQAAHFAAYGREQELEDIIKYINTRYSDHIVILDAKRGDVGATAAFYAKEAYVRYQADTVTLNPYLGKEAIAPFLAYEDKGVVILCRTSNANSDWLQAQGEPSVFLQVAKAVAQWNISGQCMLVAGATYPDELGAIRHVAGQMPLLVPGIGAQGGDLAAVLSNGLTADKTGLLISNSREILYASPDQDFAEKSAEEARNLNNQINELRS